jgi:hypothetical protein
MGYLHTVELGQAVADGDVSLETALFYHLATNCDPPLPTTVIPACVEAIGACRAGECERRVELPPDLRREGERSLSVLELVTELHLEGFALGGRG